MSSPNRAVFIDRDGTILKEPADEQIDDFSKMSFLPDVISNLKKISALDRYEDFIQIPGVAQPASSAPQRPGVVEPERLTPVADGFVRDGDAALSQQIFHITETQAEAVVEPNSMADDLAGKAETVVAG